MPSGPNPIDLNIPATSGQGYYGPFEYNGTLFALLHTGTPTFGVYSKAIATEPTWTPEAAPPGGLITSTWSGATYFDGQRIWYLSWSSVSPEPSQILYFDCATRDWTTFGSQGGASLWITQIQAILPMPDGSVLVFGTDAVTREIGFFRVTSGGWSSFTVLHTESGDGADTLSGCMGVANDGVSAVAHVIYEDFVTGTGELLYYRKVFGDNSFSAEQLIASGAQGNIGYQVPALRATGTTATIYGNQMLVAQTIKNGYPASSSAWVSSALDETMTNPASWTLIPGYVIPNDTDSQSMEATEFGLSGTLRLLVNFNNSDPANYFIETTAPGADLYLYSHGYKYDVHGHIVADAIWAAHWNGTSFDAATEVVDFFPGPSGSGDPGGAFVSVEYVPLLPTPTLTLTYDNHPGTVGTPYTGTLVPSGGTPPYTIYQITVGVLPPGLSLTGSTGVISGIPTTPGTYPFTACVTDSLENQACGPFSITITRAGDLLINFIGAKTFTGRQ